MKRKLVVDLIKDENPRAVKEALQKVLKHYSDSSNDTEAQKSEVLETLKHLNKAIDQIIEEKDKAINLFSRNNKLK